MSRRFSLRSGLGVSRRGWLRGRFLMSRRRRFRGRLCMGGCRWLGSRLCMGCGRGLRSRLRMSCRRRLGRRLRMSRGCWFRSRFGMSGGCRLRSGLLMSGRRSFILGRPSCSCFILSGLVLGCLCLSSFVLSGLVLCRLALGGLALSGFVLGCLILGGLVLCGFVLSRRSFVGCSRLLGRYYACTAKLARLCRGSDCGSSLVHGRQECMVRAGSVHVLGLHRCWRRVLPACHRLFRGCRTGGNSTCATVIANMVYRGFVDYGLVVDVVNDRDIHVVHRGVVAEGSVGPISTAVADATVAEAIVDATVEADLAAPVAFIPSEGIAAPTPIAGSPEQANAGRLHPRARHPEIAFIAVRPITGRPQITFSGNHGLGVNRQRGRSDRDGHAKLRERGGRYGQHYNC